MRRGFTTEARRHGGSFIGSESARPTASRAVRTGLLTLWLLVGVAVLLVACGGTTETLAGVAASPNTVQLPSDRTADPIQLQYNLGKPGKVTITISSSEGDHVLRDAEARSAGAHFVLFDGIVGTGVLPQAGGGAVQTKRVLAAGQYHYTVKVQPDDGSAAVESSADFTISGDQPQLPTLENVQVRPSTISPNGDAIDDVAEITFRLPQTSTTAVFVQGPDGAEVPVLAPDLVPAGEQSVVFNGRDLYNELLPDGNYTATVQVRDTLGNELSASTPITVAGAGSPDVALLAVKITPPALMLGGDVHIQFTVKNTGKVSLRTQGPDSGYKYNTNESYSSIEDGKYVDQAGLWRVGADWEGNAGGAPYRYPYRWGFGKTLEPGESVTIDGYITVLKQERTMWFFGGLLQEGVTIWLDRLGRTPVQVSW